MPTFQFEAMDATGQEIRDVIEAATEEEAQATIRQMGYFVTRIAVKKSRAAAGAKAGTGTKKKRGFTIGGASTRQLCTFTRQLSILQDAGLPILRSLRILEEQQKPGALKYALMDVCDEIEGGATLSEAMAKSSRVFNRLFVNMIKAGEAGGALEVILQRLADFMERAQALKRKVQGAMIYPGVVVTVAVGILTFIMLSIVPVFDKMFKDFKLTLPGPTLLLIAISRTVAVLWWAIPLFPLAVWITIMIIRKFPYGRMGWDLFMLKLPIAGPLIEKNIMARTTRTLGTLVASGVPILEGLNITRETAGNAMFEQLYGKVSEAIREGDTIARPMKANARPSFHPMALFFWVFFGPALVSPIIVPVMRLDGMAVVAMPVLIVLGVLGGIWYGLKFRARIVDELVVNMIDVGEETGELDTMLYKVADTYDDEVKTLTDGLMAMMEPLMIVFLGGAVGFIVVSLFMPLVSLITNLSAAQ